MKRNAADGLLTKSSLLIGSKKLDLLHVLSIIPVSIEFLDQFLEKEDIR